MLHQSRRAEDQLLIANRVVPQAAAICLVLRENADPQVMLVRSKRTGQWGIPKGGIEPGELSWKAAEREAFEEAGVVGVANSSPVGHFSYTKHGNLNRYRLAVHVLVQERIVDQYPEQGVRERRLFPITDAIEALKSSETSHMCVDVLERFQVATPFDA